MMPKSKTRKKTPKMNDSVEAVVEAPKTRKRSAETGPRTFKPVQIVAGVVDGEVVIYAVTKDELTAARSLCDVIRTDTSVKLYTHKVS